MKGGGARHRGWGQICGLGLLLFALIATLSTVSSIHDWQLRFSDTFFRLSPAPRQASPVVLVTIDDDSLQRYGRWPWSRILLARLTNNLTKAGAEVVGLDILLLEPQSREADEALRGALEAGRAVIVDKIAAFPDGFHWVEPLPQFARASAAVGHAQAPLDVDSVCRRYPPRELTLDGSRWAFAVEVARRIDAARTAAFLHSYGVPVTDDNAAVIRAKPMLVQIPYRTGGFDTISARAVLDGLDPTRVRGRPVLVGFGTTEIGDRLSTPLHPEFPTPGVEVHAQILDGILTGRTLRDIPLWAGAGTLLATCVAAVAIFRNWHGVASLTALLVSSLVVYGMGLLTFVWAARVLPVGAMLLAVVGAPLVVYAGDFVRVEKSVTEQLLALRSWLALRGKNGGSRDKTDLSWRLELLQQLQTELGALYELHKTLLESTQDLVAIFDEHGRLLLKNQPFARAYQLEAGSSLTLHQARERWIPSDGTRLVPNGAVEEGEVTIDNELYSVRVGPLPPTHLSPKGGAILTLTSLRTRVERDRARAEALGFITHELRTPLSSIQGFAELMMRYPSSPACSAAPETIFRESKRLLALISSYLDVLRLEAGAKPVSSSLVELDGIVQQVFDILRLPAQAAGMRLVFDQQDPVSVIGDEPLINGAILNLVSNALKYGTSGSDIRVRCFRANEEVIISVHNQGKPIAKEEIARLFDPYYRASNAEKNKTGWGLGLAFVKRIAEKHGGAVRVENQASGILFEIHLPAHTESAVATKEFI
jgi:signal transduction histidine kinase/CHASE2 domain-containing sensor protein